MSTQYGRQLSLIVSGIDGNGLDLSAFRIVFKVNQADLQQPNTAQIRIYNLKDSTSQKIENEFTRVILQAGYSEPATIFDGTIVQIRRGRENATDTYLDISGADGDKAYNYAIVSSTLASNYSHTDVYDAVVAGMKKYGVDAGQIPEEGLGDYKGIRGKTIFGPAKGWMEQLAATTDTRWSIQDGKVNMVKLDGYLPGEVVVLNSKSGMVGIPEQTVGGINVRCLLNPRLKYSRRVKINEGDINRQAASLNVGGILGNSALPRVVTDGVYRIVICDHEGDTRGNDWYSNLICVAASDVATPSLIERGLN